MMLQFSFTSINLILESEMELETDEFRDEN